MTTPRGARELNLAEVTPPARLGRSWVLLLGVLPVDYDDIGIAELDPGRRFLERSTMATMRSWQHERTIDPVDGGCIISDHLAFEPRAAVPGGIARRIVVRLFAHRHRRLRAYFG
jgi:ligand-binding SRPBCC domain-containing protein